MKNKVTRLLRRYRGIIPALAMLLAVQSVASTCFFCLHQPDVPKSLQNEVTL